MIIHYNCTIGSFLLHSFLLIYHPYPPSFHEVLVKVPAEYTTGYSELGMCLEGLIEHSAAPHALLASRHIPRSLYPVVYELSGYFNWFSVRLRENPD